MKKHRVLLNVKRMKQRPGECAIAASAALAYYYDKNITYSEVRKLISARYRKDGLYSSDQARLLNKLGCGKVTIVTADLDYVDFGWAKLSQPEILQKLKKMRTHFGRAREKYLKAMVHNLITWLESDEYDNQLRIDQDFPKWIKMYLDNGRPVGADFNWTALHKLSKRGPHGKVEDIRGEVELHAVVIRGYDDEGVFIVDSHSRCYTGKRKKYRNGYYKVPWHRYLVNAPAGDLVLVG